jgi:hypothetical protein
MEQHPVGPERILNARLSAFARAVLDNDVNAQAVVRTLNIHHSDTETANMLGGEPSVCEDEGRLVGGIQVGYENRHGSGVSRQYYYVDLFYFDEATGNPEPTAAIIETVATLPEDERADAIALAWRTWLVAMHHIGKPEGEELYRDRYTGEIGLAFSMPPSHQQKLQLPAL